jgi:hypothetical protein
MKGNIGNLKLKDYSLATDWAMVIADVETPGSITGKKPDRQ